MVSGYGCGRILLYLNGIFVADPSIFLIKDVVSVNNLPSFPFSNPLVSLYDGIPGLGLFKPEGGHVAANLLCSISPILTFQITQNGPIQITPKQCPGDALGAPSGAPSGAPTDASESPTTTPPGDASGDASGASSGAPSGAPTDASESPTTAPTESSASKNSMFLATIVLGLMSSVFAF
jgi:hypothetical protein